MRKDQLRIGPLLSKTLSNNSPSIGSIFMVLVIIPPFQFFFFFWPVKYRFEGLHILFPTTGGMATNL